MNLEVMNAPTERDLKKLFALSLNQCAFPNCIASIIGLNDEMIGEICHIKARNPEGPRYDANQTDQERHGFNNLILLCRNHHKVVDDSPEKYTVNWLTDIKRQHEANGTIEITPEDARLAQKLLDAYVSFVTNISTTTIQQTATGQNITQVAGDYHNYEKPKAPKVVITPPPGAVTPAELRQITEWIENLVANTVGMTQDRAFGMWRNRFKRRFDLTKSEQLLSAQMPDVEQWHRQQLAILKRGLKTKAPDAWRNARYAAIHIAIEEMGVEKLAYYAQISARLKMKKAFTSLKQLTKRDLERVYTMVLRDAGKGA
jgi:hypothetical protein